MPMDYRDGTDTLGRFLCFLALSTAALFFAQPARIAPFFASGWQFENCHPLATVLLVSFSLWRLGGTMMA
jgi:hypothetical protein